MRSKFKKRKKRKRESCSFALNIAEQSNEVYSIRHGPTFFFFFFRKAANIIMLMVLSLLRRLRRFGSLLWYLVSVGKGMGGGADRAGYGMFGVGGGVLSVVFTGRSTLHYSALHW